MGINEVKKEILDNAKNEAKLILKEAEKEKQEILKAADSRFEGMKNSLNNEAENVLAQYKARMMAEAASGLKKQRLLLEKDLIEEVFCNALDKLSSGKEKEKHAKKFSAAAKELGLSKAYCSENDASLFKGLKPGKADIVGGIILEDSSGETRIDLSYETLLEEIKKESLADVAKILF